MIRTISFLILLVAVGCHPALAEQKGCKPPFLLGCPPKTAPPPVEPDKIVVPRPDPRRSYTAGEIYPAGSRAAGEEGALILLLTVEPDGHASTAEVRKSSGFPRLDDAAKSAALHTWQFLPGTINGKPVALQINCQLAFSLKTDTQLDCETFRP